MNWSNFVARRASIGIAFVLIGCGGADAAVLGPPFVDASSSPEGDPHDGIVDAGAADAHAEDPIDAAPSSDAGDAAPDDDRIDPIALGRSWTYDVDVLGSYPICEPGTFDDCWTAREQDGESYTDDCRGSGPVHWHDVDTFGNGYDARLIAYGK